MNGLMLGIYRSSMYHAKIISVFNLQLHFDCNFVSTPAELAYLRLWRFILCMQPATKSLTRSPVHAKVKALFRVLL
ncbi:hypothetical protein LF95_00705 [Thalassospira sp. TSL5-1]|nr:hypothetical protein LF95_00705 [Thalassospira sp. TSL5-1]